MIQHCVCPFCNNGIVEVNAILDLDLTYLQTIKAGCPVHHLHVDDFDTNDSFAMRRSLVVEECAELIQAIQKLNRKKIIQQIDYENIYKEMCDVDNTLKALFIKMRGVMTEQAMSRLSKNKFKKFCDNVKE